MGVLQALISAAKIERSPAVKRAYASSAAQVAKFAPEARAAQLAADVVQLYGEPGDQPSRQLAGMIARELARQAPDTFTAHAATVLLGWSTSPQPSQCQCAHLCWSIAHAKSMGQACSRGSAASLDNLDEMSNAFAEVSCHRFALEF